jgi:hypothetical protein
MMCTVHTDPTNFIFVPNLLRFRFESVIISVRPQIRNHLLTIRIRKKNVVKDMVEAGSDQIRLHFFLSPSAAFSRVGC